MKLGLSLVGMVCSALLLVGTARAEDDKVSDADQRAIHEVVQSQLDAFAEDDASSAFELASPQTRVRFGSPENFMRMVKENYTAIYRNQRALFTGTEVVEGSTVQVVRVTDSESHVWLVLYLMQHESDGSWRIDGCKILQTGSVSV